MSEQFELFTKTIERLGRTGILSDLILIGSWCLYFYRMAFNNSEDIPLIRTLDLDFLVKNPPRIKNSVNIPLILSELGFVEEYSLMQGFSKFMHPDLEIEFLTPEKGRGKEGPYKIEQININAQGLRYISMLQHHTMDITYKGYTVTVPQPAAFVLHKFHISRKRANDEKRIKDIEAAIELGEFIIRFEEHVEKMKIILDDIPAKWKKEILLVIEVNSSRIMEALNI